MLPILQTSIFLVFSLCLLKIHLYLTLNIISTQPHNIWTKLNPQLCKHSHNYFTFFFFEANKILLVNANISMSLWKKMKAFGSNIWGTRHSHSLNWGLHPSLTITQTAKRLQEWGPARWPQTSLVTAHSHEGSWEGMKYASATPCQLL